MKRTLLSLLLIGLVQVLAYGWALHVPGRAGIGSFDQTCYAQSAQRIAEGHPFSFSPGLPASTGQTSVLYQFLLAVPVAFGAEGDSLHRAAMVMAGFFYLVFLLGWGVVIARLFPPGSVSRIAAVLMLGASGVCGYTAFTMTDQGLWMAVSAAIAAAMACEKRGLTLALLCLAPWVRPEGMMLVVAVIGVTLIFRSSLFIPHSSFFLPLLSMLGVFVLNYWLTGRFQFSSVAYKGYFKSQPFWEAVALFGRDLRDILSAYLCSIPDSWSRFFTMTSPVVVVGFWIGGVVLVLGGGSRGRGPHCFRLLPFVLAAGMAVTSVAVGSFAGLDFDRYLAWMMPLVFLASAVGIEWLCGLSRHGFWRRLLLMVLAATVCASAVAMVMMMRKTAGPRAKFLADVRAEAAHLPTGATVGAEEFVWAYMLPSTVQFRDLLGIFTPAYFDCNGESVLSNELLKRDPSLRFDYWLGFMLDDEHDTPQNRELIRRVRGEILVPGPGPRYVRRADWSAYDRANESPIPGREPVDRLDISYSPDEQATGLWVENLSLNFVYRCFCSGKRASDGLPMCEGGMLNHRLHGFSLNVQPGKSAVLVLRTTRNVVEMISDWPIKAPVSYDDIAKVKVWVGGRLLGEYEILRQDDVFTDYRIDVPAEFLTAPRMEFQVKGKLAIFGYWLYQ